MNKYGKVFITGALTVFMLASVTACQKEGPAERAGKEVDKAVDTAGQKIEKAGDKIQDAADGNKK